MELINYVYNKLINLVLSVVKAGKCKRMRQHGHVNLTAETGYV